MFNTRSVLALVVSLSLIGGTPAVLADPAMARATRTVTRWTAERVTRATKATRVATTTMAAPATGGGAGQKGNGGGNWDSGPRIDVGGYG